MRSTSRRLPRCCAPRNDSRPVWFDNVGTREHCDGFQWLVWMVFVLPSSLAEQNVADKPPRCISVSESVKELIQRMDDAVLRRRFSDLQRREMLTPTVHFGAFGVAEVVME